VSDGNSGVRLELLFCEHWTSGERCLVLDPIEEIKECEQQLWALLNETPKNDREDLIERIVADLLDVSARFQLTVDVRD
jgi:hypothetical protein